MEKDIFKKLKETNETLDSLLISNTITNDNKVTIIGNEIFNKKLNEIIRDCRKFTTIIPNVRLHKFNNSLSIS